MPPNFDLFIEPGINLKEGDEALKTVINLSKNELKERWKTEKGKSILNTWKANNYSRKILDDLVGKYYDHTDIRGIALVGANLKKADLSSIDFYSADLQNVNFEGSDLTDSWLSESNIKGASFNWAKMDNVLVDNVDYDDKTNFIGVNLNAINFTLAALLQDLAVGQQRIIHLEKKHPAFAWFLRITCDYGRSFRRFFAWCFSVILIFALIYWLVPNLISHIPAQNKFWNSLYFSVVTFTTLGYGDIYPVSAIGKLFVILEVIIGYIMGGLLVAILARRIIGN